MTSPSLTIYTFDWLPDFPRGFVRDIRARWAAEEVGRAYDVATVPAASKSDAHLAMQPFGQVPMIVDGDLTLFESGAIVLHLATGTPLLPEAKRPEITQWVIAALNSVEPVTNAVIDRLLAEQIPEIFGPPSPPAVVAHAREGLSQRLDQLSAVLDGRDWIAGDFSAADILLADSLRVPASMGLLEGQPVLQAYVERATARPAFQRAMKDHMAHWAAADAAMAAAH